MVALNETLSMQSNNNNPTYNMTKVTSPKKWADMGLRGEVKVGVKEE
jgi:hypothetical protein